MDRRAGRLDILGINLHYAGGWIQFLMDDNLSAEHSATIPEFPPGPAPPGFSPVSRIQWVATVRIMPKSLGVNLFQSRFQDSMGCDYSLELDADAYTVVSVPFPGFNGLRQLSSLSPPPPSNCFSPVSRIQWVATTAKNLGWSCFMLFQSRFQDSMGCDRSTA